MLESILTVVAANKGGDQELRDHLDKRRAGFLTVSKAIGGSCNDTARLWRTCRIHGGMIHLCFQQTSRTDDSMVTVRWQARLPNHFDDETLGHPE